MYAVTDTQMHDAWQESLRTAQRPLSPVTIPLPSEWELT